MNDSTAVILKTVFDHKKPALVIESDWCFLAGLLCIIILYFIYKSNQNFKIFLFKKQFLKSTQDFLNTIRNKKELSKKIVGGFQFFVGTLHLIGK